MAETLNPAALDALRVAANEGTQEELQQALEALRLNNIGSAERFALLSEVASSMEGSVEATSLSNFNTEWSAIKNSLVSAHDYTYQEYANDIQRTASILGSPFKELVSTLLVQGVPESAYQQYRENLRARQEIRHTAAADVNTPQENREGVGLGLNRIEMLAAPDLNIASVMKDVKTEIAGRNLTTNAQKMEAFRDALLPQVKTKLEAWARSNDDFVRVLRSKMEDTSDGEDSEDSILEDLTGITTLQESTVGGAAIGIQNIAGNVGGDWLTASKYNRIEDDALLSNLFVGNSKRQVMQALISGNFDAEAFAPKIESQLNIMFPDDLDFDKIGEYFGTWTDVTDEQLTAEDLREIQKKLETIPKYFVGGEWEDKYHTYVRDDVAGKGALDFPEWLISQAEGFQKIFFQIILALTPVLDWWYKDDEATEEQRNGKHWFAYEGLKENAPEERGGVRDVEDVPGDESPTESDLISAYPLYGELLAEYRKAEGDEATLDIKVNGEALSADNAEDVFSSLMILTEKPDYRELLGKGLELDDLVFVAEHINGNHSDGVDVWITDGQLRFAPDLGPYVLGQSWAEEIVPELGGGALAWLTARLALGTRIGARVPGPWFVKLGATILGGLGGDALGRWNTLFERNSIPIEDLNAFNLRNAINEVRQDVGLVEETLNNLNSEEMQMRAGLLGENVDRFDWENINEVPKSIYTPQTGFSPAFASLIELGDSFWDGYVITQSDLDAFDKHLDRGITDWGYVDNDQRAFEENDALNPIRRAKGGFMVEGGTLRDYRFDNVEQFFTWLRS